MQDALTAHRLYVPSRKPAITTKPNDTDAKKLIRPYICVTGLSYNTEVRDTAAAFKRALSTTHSQVVGFLVSKETLDTGSVLGDSEHPKLKRLPELLRTAKNSGMRIALHYYGKNLSTEITRLLEFEHIYLYRLCNMLQINNILPQPKEMEEIKTKYPNIEIILPIARITIERMDAKEISNLVLNDYPWVNHILINPSIGKGKEFDIESSTKIYSEFMSAGFSGKIGFAGGIGGQNVQNIVERLEKTLGTLDFSIDAQRRLRYSHEVQVGMDITATRYGILNMEAVNAYIEDSSGAFNPDKRDVA